MRMKRFASLAAAVLLLSPLAGCSSLSHELAEREFCETVAIDCEKGIYTLSAMCFQLEAGEENSDLPKYRIFSGKGENLSVALDALEDLAQKELSFDKLTAVLLGSGVEGRLVETMRQLSSMFYANCGMSVFACDDGVDLLDKVVRADIDFTEFVRLCEDPESGGDALGFPLYQVSNGLTDGLALLPYIELRDESLFCTALVLCAGEEAEKKEEEPRMDALHIVQNRRFKQYVNMQTPQGAVSAWLTEPRVKVTYDRWWRDYFVDCSARLVTEDSVWQRARTDREFRRRLEAQGEQALEQAFTFATRECMQRYGVNLLDHSFFDEVYASGGGQDPALTLRLSIRATN